MFTIDIGKKRLNKFIWLTAMGKLADRNITIHIISRRYFNASVDYVQLCSLTIRRFVYSFATYRFRLKASSKSTLHVQVDLILEWVSFRPHKQIRITIFN